MDKTDFLQQILQAPASDEPRLVYADWLLEHGDSRGEFIHVQCALARGNLTPAEEKRLKQRERELYHAHIATWGDELPSNTRDAGFIRGFIGQVTMGVQTFIESGARICAQIPLQSVTLTGGAKRMKKLVHCPWLGQIESIRFDRNHFTTSSMATFASCAHLGNLRTLHVIASPLTTEDIEAFSKPASMLQLQRLTLNYAHVTDRDLCTMAASSAFRHLQELKVIRTALQGDFVRNAVFNDSLTHLEISDNGMHGLSGNPILLNLLTTSRPVFPNLEVLVLNNSSIGNHAFIELIQSNRFPKLRTLGLNHCQVNDEGAFILASSPFLSQLTDLRMSHNELNMEGIMALARSPYRRKGARFYLPHHGISARDIRDFRREFGNFGQLM